MEIYIDKNGLKIDVKRKYAYHYNQAGSVVGKTELDGSQEDRKRFVDLMEKAGFERNEYEGTRCLSTRTVASILCVRYSVPYRRGLDLAKSIEQDSVIDIRKRFRNEKELITYLDRMEMLGTETIKNAVWKGLRKKTD